MRILDRLLIGRNLSSLAKLAVEIDSTGTPGIVVRAASGQVANLLDIQNSSGTSLLSLDKDGDLTVTGQIIGASGSAGTPSISLGSYGIYNAGGAEGIVIVNSGVNRASINYLGGFISSNTGFLGFTSDSNALSGVDAVILRDAAHTLALRNGTNAQTLNIYATYTDGSNYRRASLYYNGGNGELVLASEGAGTGSTPNLRVNGSGNMYVSAGNGLIQFDTGGSARWKIDSSGHLVAYTDNTYDIGASGANRPANIYAAGTINGFDGQFANYLKANNGLRTDGSFMVDSRSRLASSANGFWNMTNWTSESFTQLTLGLETSAFPALKRNGAGIDIIKADDSGYASLAVSSITSTNSGVIWSMAAQANGDLLFSKDSSASFKAGDSGSSIGVISHSGSLFVGARVSITGVDNDIPFARIGNGWEFPSLASLGTVSTNSARVGAKDVGGTTEIFVKNESGVETQLSGDAVFPGTLSVTGATTLSGQLTINGNNKIQSNSDAEVFDSAGIRIYDYNTPAIELGSATKILWSSGVPGVNGDDISQTRLSAGVLQIGDGSANANGSLRLTNLEALGTLSVTGATTLTGGLIGGVQSLSGAGAVNLTTLTTAFTSTGVGDALTLANGTNGQVKTICHVADGGSGVLTPTTANGYTTITFTNAGDSVTLQYFSTGGWCITGSRGVTIG